MDFMQKNIGSGWPKITFAWVALRMLVCVGLVVGLPCAHSQTGVTAKEMVPANFVDTTAGSGVQFMHQAYHTTNKYLIETMGSGVALFDYDHDGLMDLFAVNGATIQAPVAKGTIPQKTGPKEWNRLYRNNGDGTFTDVTEKAGLQGVGYGMGVAAGDYDNDGNEDLYVTAYGGNKLYHNNGDGTFTDVTQKAGVGGSGWSTSAAWVDLDADGYLDLVVLRYVKWDWDDLWCGQHQPGYRGYCHPDVFQPISMLVYHNNGNGTFTEEAHQLGLDKPGKGLGVAIADYDRDGHIDLFVANDSMEEFLFHNKGNGTFEEVGLDTEVAVDGEGRTYAGMGADFSDYNNDGLPDLVITNLANQQYALYKNSGDGTFNYATYMTGIGSMTLLHSGWGVRFVDYDNDGWKDLLIAQGHDLDNVGLTYPQIHYREPFMVARNIDGKKFVDVSSVSGALFKQHWVGRGMAIADINNDGRMDAVVTENGGPLHILINQTQTGNHWIGVRLVGHKSNRDGIGAVIKIVTASGPQWQTVTTAVGYLSSSDPRAHFGLGNSVTVQSMEIRWPSGIVQTLNNLAGDRYITVDEPAGAAKRW
jgi:hypothetical protein